MGMRMLPFFKSKKGWQFAGGGNIDEYGDLPIATESSPGCVKPDGTTTTVSSAGALSAATATGSAAGIVKPDGETIEIEDGVISAATATGSAAGIVKPDGETIEIDDGEISTPALLQKEELPTASADELGKRYLYTGATGSGLVNGYVYKCVSDGGDPATYSWVVADVQSHYTVLASVTADGVKTQRELWDTLASMIDLTSVDATFKLQYGNTIYNISNISSKMFSYIYLDPDGDMLIASVQLKTSATVCGNVRYRTASPTMTFNNTSNDTVSNGSILSILR